MNKKKLLGIVMVLLGILIIEIAIVLDAYLYWPKEELTWFIIASLFVGIDIAVPGFLLYFREITI